MQHVGGMTSQRQIDKILYLAGLVSDQRQIDPYLDSLRQLTSKKDFNSQNLQPQELAVLATIEGNIAEYLIRHEPLRSFTAQSLEQHLYEHWEAKNLMRRLHWELAFIVGLNVLCVGGLLAFGVRTDISLIVSTTICYSAGVYLFLSILGRFSPAVAATFRLYALGFVIGTTTIIINTFIIFLYDGKAPWDKLWVLNFGFSLEYVPMYIASIRLARLQAIKSHATNAWLVGAIAVIGAIALALTPDGREIEPIAGSVGAVSWIGVVLGAACAVLMWRIWHVSTTLYRIPMRALCLTLITGTVGWTITVITPYFSEGLYQPVSSLANVFFVAATAMLVYASYTFNRLGRY